MEKLEEPAMPIDRLEALKNILEQNPSDPLAIIIPELNQLGQFARVVEHRYSRELIRDGIEVVSLNKYQGLPFRPVEIFDKIVEVAQVLTERARVK